MPKRPVLDATRVYVAHLHMDVEHRLRIAKERKKNADGVVSAAKNDPRKIPHHNIYM